MSTRSTRKTPASAVGYDYSEGFGPDLGVASRSGGGYSRPGAYERAPQHFGSQPGVPVGFVDAVRHFYAKYTQFSGRASRSEYWWATLYVVGVAVLLELLVVSIGTSPTGEHNVLGVVISLLMLAFWAGNLVPAVAVSVRRLHDVNLSGWFYLLSLVPLVGGLVLLVLMVLPGRPHGSRFDR